MTLVLLRNWEIVLCTWRLEVTAFWDVMPCISEKGRSFGGTYDLHLQDRGIGQERNGQKQATKCSTETSSFLCSTAALQPRGPQSSYLNFCFLFLFYHRYFILLHHFVMRLVADSWETDQPELMWYSSYACRRDECCSICKFSCVFINL
jgi:hypothetical protein